MRVCKLCGVEKELHDFQVNKECIGGRGYSCKACVNARQRINEKSTHRLAARRAARARNADKIREQNRAWRNANLERHKAAVSRWWREKTNLVRAARARTYAKRAANPDYVAHMRISRQLRSALGHGRVKDKEGLLGYTWAELRAHIERQFLVGMCWANRKDWHIDHIVPLSSFGPVTPDVIKKAWALPNLRPIWASENIRKRDRREFLL